jgi:hypothetical protein
VLALLGKFADDLLDPPDVFGLSGSLCRSSPPNWNLSRELERVVGVCALSVTCSAALGDTASRPLNRDLIDFDLVGSAIGVP